MLNGLFARFTVCYGNPLINFHGGIANRYPFLLPKNPKTLKTHTHNDWPQTNLPVTNAINHVHNFFNIIFSPGTGLGTYRSRHSPMFVSVTISRNVLFTFEYKNYLMVTTRRHITALHLPNSSVLSGLPSKDIISTSQHTDLNTKVVCKYTLVFPIN